MDNVIRAIRVRDANGDALTLFEYEQRQQSNLSTIGLGARATRLALDTGEEAKRVDDKHFVLVASGEKLTRID